MLDSCWRQQNQEKCLGQHYLIFDVLSENVITFVKMWLFVKVKGCLRTRNCVKMFHATSTVCNFQSMKSPVELNSLFLKFFCYITWFDETRHWRSCKWGLYVKFYHFFETTAQQFKSCKLNIYYTGYHFG